MRKLHVSGVLVFILTIAALAPPALFADESAAIQEIVTLGTRSAKPRSATDSTAPIDVISSDDLTAIGGAADITDNLNTLVPSYTATPATGDDSAMMRPTTLRGMAADQMLVLVNGKRRHRSSVVQLFAPAANNGSHAPDIAMIPGIALKNVEVLRDGAASQYGSDAIAGVINFALKDASEGGSLQATYGEHFEGEANWKVSGNVGLPLGDSGFLNLSMDTNDNEGLSRGNQRPNAQALIDMGVQGVGADAVFDDEPFVQSWGRPESEGTRFVVNAGIPVSEDAELYAFGNYAETEGIFRFFYRDPGNSDLDEQLDLGATNLARESMAGYTPYLVGEQQDFSFVTGIRGELSDRTNYDFSVGFGRNELDYTLYSSLNGDAMLINGSNAQRTFDTGDFEQEEFNVNADFSTILTDSLVLSYGAEYREESFTIIAGEEQSYVGGGVSGRAGIRPEDAGENERDNYAVYADLEHDVTDRWLMQYALRFEDFSDFGETINGKIASRYFISDRTAIRGSISTGFHAPTPGQANIRNTITTFDNLGNQIDIGLLPADSPEVAAVGGAPLKEEESVGITLGFTTDLGEATTLTVDGYHIEVDDRIYRTEISIEDVSFFTNALDVEHRGIDVVLTSEIEWSESARTDVSFAYNYNTIEVKDAAVINGFQVVSDDLVEDIENNYAEHNFTLTGNTYFYENWSLMTRARYIGDHYDERGNISGTSSVGKSAEIDPVVYVDVELNYDFSDAVKLTLGASNIFDEYPDEIKDEPGQANRVSVGLPYPRRSPANYEGGSWYMRMTYNF
ncbi:MAG: TonB-dependent receptor plug domain-containing protein [bacterium]